MTTTRVEPRRDYWRQRIATAWRASVEAAAQLPAQPHETPLFAWADSARRR